MRILYLGRYLNGSDLPGPEKSALRLYEEAAERNEALFITYFFNGNEYGLAAKLFGQEKMRSAKTVLRLGIVPMLFKVLAFNPQIVHVVNFERFIIFPLLLLRRLLGFKVVYTAHGAIQYEDELNRTPQKIAARNRRIEMYLLAVANRVAVYSNVAARFLKQYNPDTERKLFLTRPGIANTFFAVQKKRTGTPAVVMLGSHAAREAVLPETLAALDEAGVPLTVYLVGGAAEPPRGFADITVHAVPRQDEAGWEDILAKADYFIAAGNYETFSIATAEAMAAGVIPFVRKGTGIERFIRQGESGFVFTGLQELRQQVKEINSSPTRKAAMAAAAREAVRGLSWENAYFDCENIYEKLTEQR